MKREADFVGERLLAWLDELVVLIETAGVDLRLKNETMKRIPDMFD